MKESVSGLLEIYKGNYNCLFLSKLMNGFESVEFADKYLKIINSIRYILDGHFNLITILQFTEYVCNQKILPKKGRFTFKFERAT